MKQAIYLPLLTAISGLDTKPEDVTSAVAFWLTPEDKALGFVLCVKPGDEKDMARMLREHADGLDPQ